MIKEQILQKCDKAAFFAICALIYFLPISIALVELFVGIPVLFFCIKRIVEFLSRIKNTGSCGEKAYPSGKFIYCIKVFAPVKNFLNKPVAAYVFFCFLSIFISFYPQLSTRAFFGKIFERAFLFFIFVECVNSEKRIKIFLTVFFISVTLICINGLSQCFNFTGFIRGFSLVEDRICSSLKHPNDFATYLILPIFMLLSFLQCGKLCGKKDDSGPIIRQQLIRAGVLILFGLTVFCFGLTFSRGAWLGVFFAFLFLCVCKVCKFRMFLFAIPIFLLIFSPVMLTVRNVSFFSDNAQESVFEKKFSIPGMGRAGFWKEAMLSISQHPILGTGLNTYSAEASKRDNWSGYYVHNCYLQMAAEIGIAGLLSFLWMLIVLFRKACKGLKSVKDRFLFSVLAGSLAGLFGFLVHSFFDTGFYSLQLNTYFWIMLGLIVSVLQINSTSRFMSG